jgi:hypothetical protein
MTASAPRSRRRGAVVAGGMAVAAFIVAVGLSSPASTSIAS